VGCVCVCVCVCESVTMIIRNCMHRSSPNWSVGKGSDHLAPPARGGGKIFDSALHIQMPACNVCVSSERFFHLDLWIQVGPTVGIILLWDYRRARHARITKLLIGEPFAPGNCLLQHFVCYVWLWACCHGDCCHGDCAQVLI